jgi:hypothetical protein
MPTLYLHIGAPKTGSTYIQSSLRMSRENLSRVGICYPGGMEDPGLEAQSLTRGNGYMILHNVRTLEKIIRRTRRTATRGLLFSNEDMWLDLQKERFRDVLLRLTQRHGFEKVRILLFLRNPIELSVSWYLQIVKANGSTKDMNNSLINFNASRTYKSTIEMIDCLEEHEGIECSVLNYSFVRRSLLAEVSGWLGVSREILATPSAEIVNRGLDISETTLQRELNKVLGAGAKILAGALTEGITDINPRKPAPSPDTQEQIWQQSKPWIDRLNLMLPDGQALYFDRMEATPNNEENRFANDQIRIIAGSLGGEIRRHRDADNKAKALMRMLMNRFRTMHHSNG